MRILLITILGSLIISAHAQDIPTTGKVGLALSGGAAHGFAHIGVLKYFEEIGLEVDYIAGTSMGSVVGGLYAMGYTADEIARISLEQDWELLISNHSPLWEVAPIEKETHEKIPLSIVWKGSAFRFPQGLIQGQKLDLIISKIYSPAYFIDDFDDLHIPFRCLAVDIEDGSIDVLDSGFLGEAIRASMAIPTVFPPKEIDGTLYVDGGLLRNYPVQEVKEMGADILLGVYVGSELDSKEKLYSAFDIFRQASWMSSVLDSKEQEKLLHVSIAPDVKDLGAFDFEESEKFIQLGYEKAKSHAETLKKIAKNQVKKTKYNPKLNKLNFLRFAEIGTTESDPILQKMIINNLKFGTGTNVSFDKLEESLSLVYGNKNFSKTSYDFDIVDNGIELIVNSEDVDPYSFGVSLNRFLNYNSSLILTAGIRNKFGKPSNLTSTVRISENPGIQANYYLRIPRDPSLLFNISGKYETYLLPLFDGNALDRLYRADDAILEIGMGKEWKNMWLFNLHYVYDFDKIRPIIFKEDDIRRYRTHRQLARARILFNSLGQHKFPEAGTYFNGSLGYVYDNRLFRLNQLEDTDFLTIPEDIGYYNVDVALSHYRTYKNITGEFHLKARFSNGESLFDSYRIGGPSQEKERVYGFIGLSDSELIAGNHISGKLGARFNFNDKVFVTPQVHYLYGTNYLSYAFDAERTISLLGFGVGFGLDTPIGPVTLDVGKTNLTDRIVANIGFGFRHIL
jgi:NTE family protein